MESSNLKVQKNYYNKSSKSYPVSYYAGGSVSYNRRGVPSNGRPRRRRERRWPRPRPRRPYRRPPRRRSGEASWRPRPAAAKSAAEVAAVPASSPFWRRGRRRRGENRARAVGIEPETQHLFCIKIFVLPPCIEWERTPFLLGETLKHLTTDKIVIHGSGNRSNWCRRLPC